MSQEYYDIYDYLPKIILCDAYTHNQAWILFLTHIGISLCYVVAFGWIWTKSLREDGYIPALGDYLLMLFVSACGLGHSMEAAGFFWKNNNLVVMSHLLTLSASGMFVLGSWKLYRIKFNSVQKNENEVDIILDKVNEIENNINTLIVATEDIPTVDAMDKYCANTKNEIT